MHKLRPLERRKASIFHWKSRRAGLSGNVVSPRISSRVVAEAMVLMDYVYDMVNLNLIPRGPS
jgi:hypothetical protein